jgi:hypothetical protein
LDDNDGSPKSIGSVRKQDVFFGQVSRSILQGIGRRFERGLCPANNFTATRPLFFPCELGFLCISVFVLTVTMPRERTGQEPNVRIPHAEKSESSRFSVMRQRQRACFFSERGQRNAARNGALAEGTPP